MDFKGSNSGLMLRKSEERGTRMDFKGNSSGLMLR
jgi:hypothetical protein